MALFSGYGAARPAPPPRGPRPLGSKAFVGTQTRAYQQAHPPGAAGAPRIPIAPGWEPPPASTFDPTRDIEIEEGSRGLSQLESGAATERARDLSDYYNRAGAVGKAREQEGQDYSKAKDALNRAFSVLGGRQGEQAQKYGVAGGGALLQAAAKRAANQGIQQQSADMQHQRRGEGFDTQLAELALQLAPPDQANPFGGRTFQDIGTKVSNAQANQAFFETHQHSLEGAEAGKAGYEPPVAPAPPRAPAPRRAAPARQQNPFKRFQRRGL